jgi:hypothetical protein
VRETGLKNDKRVYSVSVRGEGVRRGLASLAAQKMVSCDIICLPFRLKSVEGAA